MALASDQALGPEDPAQALALEVRALVPEDPALVPEVPEVQGGLEAQVAQEDPVRDLPVELGEQEFGAPLVESLGAVQALVLVPVPVALAAAALEAAAALAAAAVAEAALGLEYGKSQSL